MSTAIVKGSLQSVAEQSNASIAESFMGCDTLVIVDVSGSMAERDARGGRERYQVACDELKRLQQSLPGKVGVVAFSTYPEFAPGGMPNFQGGGTNLTAALEFVRVADGTVKFVVISDGEPNDERSALAIARSFTSKIDTVYVGPESDRRGADFLRRLAEASGGRYVVAEKADQLADQVQRLMLGNGSKS